MPECSVTALCTRHVIRRSVCWGRLFLLGVASGLGKGKQQLQASHKVGKGVTRRERRGRDKQLITLLHELKIGNIGMELKRLESFRGLNVRNAAKVFC